jgi:hypothetical protein
MDGNRILDFARVAGIRLSLPYFTCHSGSINLVQAAENGFLFQRADRKVIVSSGFLGYN